MTVRATSSFRPRCIQLICICLNFLVLMLAVINVAFCTDEFGHLPHKVSTINKFAFAKLGNESGVDKQDLSISNSVGQTLYFAFGVCLATVAVSLIVAMSIILEHRGFLIASILFCAIAGIGACSCGILSLSIRFRTSKIISKAFATGIHNYGTLSKEYSPEQMQLQAYYTHLIDVVQFRAHCCGYNNFTDFHTVYSCTSLEEENFGPQNLPFTCCRNYKILNEERLLLSCVSVGGIGVHDFGSIFTEPCKNNIDKLANNWSLLASLFGLEFVVLTFQTAFLITFAYKYVEWSKSEAEEQYDLQKRGFRSTSGVSYRKEPSKKKDPKRKKKSKSKR